MLDKQGIGRGEEAKREWQCCIPIDVPIDELAFVSLMFFSASFSC